MATQWYVRIGGRESGPHSTENLKQLGASGRIPATAEVRRDNGPWVSATSVQGLVTAPAAHRRDSVSMSADETLRVAAPLPATAVQTAQPVAAGSVPTLAAPRSVASAAAPIAAAPAAPRSVPQPISPPALPGAKPTGGMPANSGSGANGEPIDKPYRRRSNSTVIVMGITLAVLSICAAVVLVLALATGSQEKDPFAPENSSTVIADKDRNRESTINDITAVDTWRDVGSLRAVSKGPVRVELLQYYLTTAPASETHINNINEAAADASLYLVVELGISSRDEDRPTQFKGWNRGEDNDSSATLTLIDAQDTELVSPILPGEGSDSPKTVSLNKTVMSEKLVFPLAVRDFHALRLTLPYQAMRQGGALGLEFSHDLFAATVVANDGSDTNDTNDANGTGDSSTSGEPEVDIKTLIDGSSGTTDPPATTTPSEPTDDIRDIIDGGNAADDTDGNNGDLAEPEEMPVVPAEPPKQVDDNPLPEVPESDGDFLPIPGLEEDE